MKLGRFCWVGFPVVMAALVGCDSAAPATERSISPVAMLPAPGDAGIAYPGDLTCPKDDCERAGLTDPELNASYQRLAWQTFAALLQTTEGRRAFAPWKTASQLLDVAPPFQPEGGTPECHDVGADLEPFETPIWLANDAAVPEVPSHRPLWDQNGNLVELEVRINELAEHKLVGILDTVAGQLLGGCDEVGLLPLIYGRAKGSPAQGPLRIKLAWKKLAGADRAERFVLHPEHPDYGLVALHLAQRPFTTGELWVWSTFEHIDNLEAHEGHGPLFRNDTCSDCLPNKCPAPGADGKRRTQVARLTPISDAADATNREAHARYAPHDAVFAYYQLIGTQWTTQRRITAPIETPPGSAIIEWDRQESSCMGCHSHATAWTFSKATHEAACKQLSLLGYVSDADMPQAFADLLLSACDGGSAESCLRDHWQVEHRVPAYERGEKKVYSGDLYWGLRNVARIDTAGSGLLRTTMPAH